VFADVLSVPFYAFGIFRLAVSREWLLTTEPSLSAKYIPIPHFPPCFASSIKVINNQPYAVFQQAENSHWQCSLDSLSPYFLSILVFIWSGFITACSEKEKQIKST
jgi:hypothetical protein